MHLRIKLAAMGDVARINGPAQGYYPNTLTACNERWPLAFFNLGSRRAGL
ncbi:MAG TPA: hypothetical protein VGL78_16165 [Solirubrobacteraceae bacterium]